MNKKRGQLSLDEEKYIRNNVDSLSVEDIAEYLNRSTAPVKRYIEEQKLFISSDDKKDDETLRYKLHSKTFWSEIIRQFDEDTGELK